MYFPHKQQAELSPMHGAAIGVKQNESFPKINTPQSTFYNDF
jgi:hypothetical protein